MSPTHEAIVALRRNLRAKYGLHADMELINAILTAKLEGYVMLDIEAVVSSWTPKQLADGLEANHEAIKLEAASEGGEH